MEARRIDFKAYKTGEMLVQVIYHFDLRGSTGGRLIRRGPCPLCCLTKPTSRHLAVDTAKGVWFCHGCKKSGDALTLYSLVANVDVYQAAKDLSQLTRTAVPYLDEGRRGMIIPDASTESTTPPQANRNNNVAPPSAGFKIIDETPLPPTLRRRTAKS